MNLECAHVNVRHEVIPIFVIMDKDAQIPKLDVEHIIRIKNLQYV